LHNLLTVSEAIARSALVCKESRGGHFREDFPGNGDEFGKINLVAAKGPDGRRTGDRILIAERPDYLQRVIDKSE
jgi:succinate dehydrogenase / fumarate reductase flavoprotein subunit